jgi:hypothetical protein
MSSVQRSTPAGQDSHVRPIKNNPYLFRTGRVPLVVQGVLLVALGGWGLIVNATNPATERAGAPVLMFHITTLHGWVLLATGLLAVISAQRRRIALIFTGLEFLVYTLLFMVGSVDSARHMQTPLGFDAGDSILHLIVAVLGAALFMWLAGQGLEGRWWIRTRARVGQR